MATRRLSGKALLAAAVALAVLGGLVAAAVVATSDEDGGGPFGTPVATAPDSAQPETEAAPDVPPETTPSTPPAEREADEPEATPEATPEASPDPGEPSGEPQPTRARRDGRGRPPRRLAVPPAREFSGTGNARLGTVDVRTSSVVKWSTNGRFELRFGREAYPIIAPAASGEFVLPPFKFDRVRVVARGRWKISITPQR
jgi:hypothetical protein